MLLSHATPSNVSSVLCEPTDYKRSILLLLSNNILVLSRSVDGGGGAIRRLCDSRDGE